MHSLHGWGQRPASTSGAKTVQKVEIQSRPTNTSLTFNLFPNLVARSGSFSTVHLRSDEFLILQLVVSYHISGGARHGVQDIPDSL